MRVKYRGGIALIHNDDGQSVVTVEQARLGYLLSQVDSEGAQEDLVLRVVTWKASTDLDLQRVKCLLLQCWNIIQRETGTNLVIKENPLLSLPCFERAWSTFSTLHLPENGGCALLPVINMTGLLETERTVVSEWLVRANVNN